MREIVVDTETTGLDPRAGHRVVEVACVELHDFSPTGRWFHAYVHPQRRMDADAQRVHGLTDAFLADKPAFADPAVLLAMVEFIADDPLVAHNAAFDRAFLEHEFALADHRGLEGRVWIDTLGLAQSRFPGASNSLDALCRRFRLSLAERERHGALIDARLLAQVYLELRGGRERSFELIVDGRGGEADVEGRPAYSPRPRPLGPRLTAAEAAAHADFVTRELGADSLWLRTARECALNVAARGG